MAGELHPNELHSVGIRAEMDLQIAERVGVLQEEGITPTLAIISDNFHHKPSRQYIGIKQRVAHSLGMVTELSYLPMGYSLADRIDYCNEQPGIHGMLVQLPSYMYEGDELDGILAKIDPIKDVDGLGPDSVHMAATPAAIRRLMDGNGIDYWNKNFLVVGLGKLVGAPLLRGLRAENHPSIQAVDAGTDKLERATLASEADVIVSAMGRPRSVTRRLSGVLKPTGVWIDAGTAEHDGVVAGDVSKAMRNELLDRGWKMNAVTGSLGPVTVRELLENTVTATEKQAGIA